MLLLSSQSAFGILSLLSLARRSSSSSAIARSSSSSLSGSSIGLSSRSFSSPTTILSAPVVSHSRAQMAAPVAGSKVSSSSPSSATASTVVLGKASGAAASKGGSSSGTSSSPKSASPSGAAVAAAAIRSYDYKPILSRHQAIYKPLPSAAAATWTPSSCRVGVVALKAGMCADYDSWGVRRALTALALEDVTITGVARAKERGYTALQVGAGEAKVKNVPAPLKGHYAHLGIAPKRKVAEFRVSEDALLPPKTTLDVRHFVPGQYVNVQGVTQGKGFQGGMKRHGFAGQKASHGNSVSHRALGATGCRQDPGKVIKGKKMPGHMGAVTVTTECLRVYKIDIKRGLIYLEGSVPGRAGSYIKVYDAPKKPHVTPPPFPTYIRTPEDEAILAMWKLQQEGTAVGGVGAKDVKLASGDPPHEFLAAPPAVDPFAIPENDEAEEV